MGIDAQRYMGIDAMGDIVFQALGSSKTIHDVEEGSASRSEHRFLDLRGIEWTSAHCRFRVMRLDAGT